MPSRDNNSWNAGVSASWNVFDSNITSAKIAQAEINVEQAKLELEKKSDEIDLEVTEAYLNLQEAQKRFKATGLAIKKAKEDFLHC